MFSRPRKFHGILACVALSANCNCDPENFSNLEPKIKLEVCSTEGVTDCVATFGSVAIGTSQTVHIKVENTGEADLTLTEIELGGAEPAFSITGQKPTRVKPGGIEFVEVLVKFSPSVASEVQDTLRIASNAPNAPGENKQVEVALRGTGRDMGLGHFTVNPAACAFGEVGVGTRGYCDLSLGNDGTRELTIEEDWGFEATSDPAFQIAGAFFPPVGLPPGSAMTLRVQFSPTQPIAYAGGLFLTYRLAPNSSPERVDIPLTGQGGVMPTAVARVASINGVPNTSPSPQVQPLDDVVVTGEDSTVGTPGRTITGYAWEIVEKPVTSTATLTTPAQATTKFRFNSSGQNVNGIDVAGTFVVRLTVTDSGGDRSSNDARVTINAVPSEDLHIQVTWDDGRSDVDMHLIKGLGPRWGTNDCHFANCKPLASGASTLTWGPDPDNNPHLDVDDVNGYGPENININRPAPGNYNVGVHFYDGHGAFSTVATVKIFVQGALIGEYTRQINCSQPVWWNVATIVWGSTATLQETNVMETDVGHGVCR